jgi:hypothetical protein
MSSPHPFLTNENMKLLWDVLMDHELFQNKPKDFLIQINYLLNQNIQSFFEQERNHSQNLIDLNKKFITLLLNHIQKMILTEQTKNITKPNLVTSEEIQTHRQNQFEKDLNLKQQEFTNAMTLPVPPTPTFQDKIEESLTELELEIKRTIAQRNYDIEHIQNNIHQVNVDPSWLKSQETSVKKDKINYPNNSNKTTTSSSSQNQAIKYIKIENKEIDDSFLKKEIIDLNTTKKHITWEDEINADSLEINLFKKLKPLPSIIIEEPKLTDRIEILETKLDKIEKMLELLLNKNEK